MAATPDRHFTFAHGFLNWWPALAGFLFIIFIGHLLLPYPGLQNDEVLFAQSLYQIAGLHYSVHIRHTDVPVMLLSYLGALKTWIYAPILKHWKPSPESIRWPVLLICAFSSALFFRIVQRLYGQRAATFAVLLLATDSSYLLTSYFDWGPVALQHLLLLAVGLFTLRFAISAKTLNLAAAAFFAGLALWDKALFLWPFGGIAVALVLVFPRQLWKRFTIRNAAVAILAFSIGAYPLILYNCTHQFATFRSNASFTFSEFAGKFAVLRATSDGSVLFGYLVNDGISADSRAPETRWEHWSGTLHSRFGDCRRNVMDWTFVAALALFPFLWFTPARRTLAFTLIAIAVGWLQMAITRDAGGSAHHAVLLWPLPQLFIAVAFAQASFSLKKAGPWILAVALTALVAVNLLNCNQYFYQLSRFGGAGSWTDAIYPLSAGVPKIPASTILVDDWGILTPLLVLHRGALPLRIASAPFMSDNPSPADIAEAHQSFAEKNAVWLGHTTANEQFTGVGARLVKLAAASGYRKKSSTPSTTAISALSSKHSVSSPRAKPAR